jgi:hypothetical protein
MKRKLSYDSIFDNNGFQDGLKIFNEFLEKRFLKYFHSHLIKYYSRTKPISEFANTIQKAEESLNFTAAFVTQIITEISPELKKLFYRYFKYDKDEKQTIIYSLIHKNEIKQKSLDKLSEYISEWVIIRLRLIIAELTFMLADDYSDTHSITVNNILFTALEIKVYNMFCMEQLSPVKQNISRKENKESVEKFLGDK